MTVRNPIVLIPGGNPQFQELPAGDTIGGASQGPVGMTWQGAWNSATSYAVDDAVSSGGSSYICILANTNHAPPNATYWNVLASKGDTGATGATGSTGATGAAGTNGTNGAMAQLSQIVTASSATTADFTSISGSSQSLRVTYFSRDTASGTSNSILRLKINNDGTAANYTSTFRSGTTNTTAFATSVASSTKGVYTGASPNDGNTSGFFSAGEIIIVGYASTTPQKIIIATNAFTDGTQTVIQTVTARWASTAAITRLTFGTDGTAFKDGSTFTLYGF